MSDMQENTAEFGDLFKTEKNVRVIKKDGSLEAFNVQKVIDAVGR